MKWFNILKTDPEIERIIDEFTTNWNRSGAKRGHVSSNQQIWELSMIFGKAAHDVGEHLIQQIPDKTTHSQDRDKWLPQWRSVMDDLKDIIEEYIQRPLPLEIPDPGIPENDEYPEGF